MRGNGPWRSMGSGGNFNRGDNYVPAHRIGEHGDYVQENVPSPDGNSNSSLIFQNTNSQQQQQNIGKTIKRKESIFSEINIFYKLKFFSLVTLFQTIVTVINTTFPIYLYINIFSVYCSTLIIKINIF